MISTSMTVFQQFIPNLMQLPGAYRSLFFILIRQLLVQHHNESFLCQLFAYAARNFYHVCSQWGITLFGSVMLLN